jgi:ferredoxin
MEKSRRGFLKMAGTSLLGLSAAVPVVASASGVAAKKDATGIRWAMVIDTRKCQKDNGCTACIDACHVTHNVPEIPDANHEVKWIWKEEYPRAFPNQVHPYTEDSLMKRQVLVMCNHCDRPPCVRVCPTQAGSFPLASRSTQKLHFSTTPLVRVGYSWFTSSMYGRGSSQLKLREP